MKLLQIICNLLFVLTFYRTQHILARSFIFCGTREMSAGKQAFKKTEATRLLKAFVDAGVDVERLRLVHDLIANTIAIDVRDGSGGPTSKGNELDHWMSSHADSSKGS
jgi:hypothetical protein